MSANMLPRINNSNIGAYISLYEQYINEPADCKYLRSLKILDIVDFRFRKKNTKIFLHNHFNFYQILVDRLLYSLEFEILKYIEFFLDSRALFWKFGH